MALRKDAQSRLAWERVMNTSPPRSAYEKTCVLLLGWTVENDDTETTEELQALQKILQQTYAFPVLFKRMHTQKHPQVQAIKHVADFVYDHDHPRHLLIVYHAGRGYVQPGSDGRLLLAGRVIRDGKNRDLSIDWTAVEPSLAKAQADVLVVFDVCYAGLLCRDYRDYRPPTRGGRKKFQYIAACTATQLTSFRLALKKLADSGGFSVSRLVETLVRYEHFLGETQQPGVYGSGYGPVDGDIWIAPAVEAAGVSLPVAGGGQAAEDGPSADVLDVRLHFAEHATEDVVGHAARAFKAFLRGKELRFHRVEFLRHKSYVEGPARRWLEMVRKKSKAC